MENKKGQPPKRPAPKNSHRNPTIGNSLSAQRLRFLNYLREVGKHGCTTIEAREALDIMMPAARVHELRWLLRFNIATVWSTATNAQGNRHRVARYILKAGKWRVRA